MRQHTHYTSKQSKISKRSCLNAKSKTLDRWKQDRVISNNSTLIRCKERLKENRMPNFNYLTMHIAMNLMSIIHRQTKTSLSLSRRIIWRTKTKTSDSRTTQSLTTIQTTNKFRHLTKIQSTTKISFKDSRDQEMMWSCRTETQSLKRLNQRANTNTNEIRKSIVTTGSRTKKGVFYIIT